MRRFNFKTQQFEEIPVNNERKPFRLYSGYIASKRSGANKGWVVIYLAKAQQIDESGGKYAVVCETHSNLVQTTSLPLARSAMKAPDFCEECYRILRPDLYAR